MHKKIIFLLPLVLAACQTVPTPESANTQKAEIILAAQNWATAFNSCDPAGAAALYDPEAVLWGTVSPTVIMSSAGVRQYFDRVCSANPQPKVTFGDQLVRVYGDTANNSGSYTFTIFSGGQHRPFPARYSFTYRKKEGKWLIVDHHSSAIQAPPASTGR